MPARVGRQALRISQCTSLWDPVSLEQPTDARSYPRAAAESPHCLRASCTPVRRSESQKTLSRRGNWVASRGNVQRRPPKNSTTRPGRNRPIARCIAKTEQLLSDNVRRLEDHS